MPFNSGPAEAEVIRFLRVTRPSALGRDSRLCTLRRELIKSDRNRETQSAQTLRVVRFPPLDPSRRETLGPSSIAAVIISMREQPFHCCE